MRRDVGWFDLPENNVGSLTTRLETETQMIHSLTGDMLGRQIKVGSYEVACSHYWFAVRVITHM